MQGLIGLWDGCGDVWGISEAESQRYDSLGCGTNEWGVGGCLLA